MITYKIEYKDLETELNVEKIIEANNLDHAEDIAYRLSDKGYYSIFEKINMSNTITGFYYKRLI